MTIVVMHGDILRANAEAIVNPVNCVGVMGRGLAAQFRRAYPENFRAYEAACKRGDVVPGKVFTFETGQATQPHLIVNLPTKRHWRDSSRMEDIESGLDALVGDVERRGINSIAIPPLGCGLGGLKWTDVKPRIESAFAPFSAVHVLLYGPVEEP